MDCLPLHTDIITKEECNKLSPLVLAYIGDAVQSLYVRTTLVCSTTYTPRDLHKLSVMQVKATSQAKALEVILEILEEDEITIYKRARNAKVNTSAKNAGIIEYKKASGYEALIGYLYLTGNHNRLNYLLSYPNSLIKED